MRTGILHVKNDTILDANGQRVVLRGAALGGWMNMENFITGFAAHEFQHCAEMHRVLDPEKYEFFFDKWQGHRSPRHDLH
ncbi:hypothetical protein NUU61_002377 [Penicillium alfredii]|uniref:Uncharacterized protein n=1 Tax=Penicillium alfredii TaxID=1506179 RepID=A0A9W9KFY5_9EURO|nr:uncharacterized protein NUU61_002377 [Penicillium alfredii]KAJ5105030.1 hypothetical protein NUU61_002377 [Penicillium alfredii]